MIDMVLAISGYVDTRMKISTLTRKNKIVITGQSNVSITTAREYESEETDEKLITEGNI